MSVLLFQEMEISKHSLINSGTLQWILIARKPNQTNVYVKVYLEPLFGVI